MEKRRRIIKFDLAAKTLSLVGCRVIRNEPLSNHCSLNIGGAAEFFIEIPNERSLVFFLNSVLADNYLVLGEGTNVLFPDEGYRGTVIRFTGIFKSISISKNEILSGGGALLSNVLKIALKSNLPGLEFVTGIPGTVGGAVYGNVGNRDEWISTVVKTVEIYKNLKKECLSKDKLNFSYRKSNLENCLITKVNFSLENETKTANLQKIFKNIQKRLETQPSNTPSAGSIFKNPDGYSAGKLIEEIGLKGKRIGNAKIDEIHGNFIVNTGGASSKDVIALIHLIKKNVAEKFNINLETEVKIINDRN
ncbi:MAG: UDP-N-acetylmuramate dehydrogenase [Endomicrobium sp.]|nr:UDP-N-acetylmuramate dehydrogenase [Endomicrobium sp.]